MIPTTARAAALVAYKEPLEIVEAPVPGELEHGAILAEVLVATICGSDVHVADGEVAIDAPLPRILGHEMMGRVAKLGPGVTHDSVGQELKVGDRIIWTHGFCGQCYQCVVVGEPTTCLHSRSYMMSALDRYPHLTGGFAEYCYVFPPSGRIRVPDEVSNGIASAAACALRTVIHAFDRLGPLDDRNTVVIQGCGPLGLFSLARAQTGGAGRVIVIGGPPERLAIARRWGADEVVDIGEVPDADARTQQILDLTDGRGADVVIEVSGAKRAFVEGMDLLAKAGRYVVVGQLHDDEIPFRPSQLVLKHARVTGVRSASAPHFYRALEFIRRHRDRFTWDDMLSGRYPLDDINTALDGMRNFSEVKPVIEIGGRA
jgi:threonine dehydrogenase-like Zn-dependent dehydrogenase